MIAPALPDSLPDLMTADETIAYLRLDAEPGDPHERLRTLYRRQGLPRIKKGRLIRYHKSDIDAWLAGERGGRCR